MIFRVIFVAVFLAIMELIQSYFKKTTSGKGLLFCLLFGMPVIFVSVVLNVWEVVLAVLVIFFVNLFRFVKKTVYFTVLDSLVEKPALKTEPPKFDIYKVMESETFPVYDKELAKKIVILTLGGEKSEAG